MHPRRAVLLAALMVSVSLSGCFGEAEVEEEAVVSSVWTFERPELTCGTISLTLLTSGATTPLT